MATTLIALAVFLASFSHSAVAANKFRTASSDTFLAAESSAARFGLDESFEVQISDKAKVKSPKDVQILDKAKVKAPKVSKKAQKCFTEVKFGRSPGSNLGNSTEIKVDDCMLKCRDIEGCFAMTFRLSDGLCNFLNRTYDEKYEESDERVVANKLDSCMTSQEFQMLDKFKVQMPKVSPLAQKCFTKVIFGRSPGSNLGNSTESSVDDCMSKCAALDECLAMTFRLSDGLCNFLDRIYDDKFEESDERVLANKVNSCLTSQNVQILDKASVKAPKVSKNAQKCFTKVTFGRSPGSNLDNSTENSVDDCMAKCEALEDCLAMTFRLSDGLCNLLDRTINEKFEASDERVLANKLEHCKKGHSTGFAQKVCEIFAFPFTMLASLFTKLMNLF